MTINSDSRDASASKNIFYLYDDHDDKHDSNSYDYKHDIAVGVDVWSTIGDLGSFSIPQNTRLLSASVVNNLYNNQHHIPRHHIQHHHTQCLNIKISTTNIKFMLSSKLIANLSS